MSNLIRGECVQMPGEWPDERSTIVWAARGDGSRQRCPRVLPERRKSAKIHASSRVIRGIPVRMRVTSIDVGIIIVTFAILIWLINRKRHLSQAPAKLSEAEHRAENDDVELERRTW